MIRFALVAFILLTSGCTTVKGPREIEIVAKGMTFTLPSAPAVANPTIQMQPGERVRVMLRNDAPGLIHDFEIPSWKVKSEQIRGGQTTSVTFTVPENEGRVQYICGPHSKIMRGIVEVRAN